jgi:membrane protein DedA with SNARE-associated domain
LVLIPPIVQTVVSVIKTVLTVGGYPGLVALMFFESFGIPPLPSEVILPFTGFLIVLGVFAFGPALAAAMLGAVLGAYAAYAVGRWGRHWLTGAGPRWFRIEQSHLDRMDRWFARWGDAMVAVARLLPIVRAYISYPAGTAKMNPTKFGVYTLLGGIPFSAALIYAGMLLRQHWDALVPYFDLANYLAIVAILLFVVWVVVRWHRDSRQRVTAKTAPGPEQPQ